MTQADGVTPTPDQIRAQMRLLKPVLERLEAALTASARLTDASTISDRFEALAELSDANDDLRAARAGMESALGLPYDRVLKASYTAIFGPDD